MVHHGALLEQIAAPIDRLDLVADAVASAISL
jgi:hypothetical protein